MKVYNHGVPYRFFMGTAALLTLAGMLYAVIWGISEVSNTAFALFVLIAICGIGAVVSFRGWLYPFIFDEKGITRKLPHKDIFIPWDDFKHIAVGEYHTLGKYWFAMVFSKTPLGEIYPDSGSAVWFSGVYSDSESAIRQTDQLFFVVYREGMLEEVLKCVDESRIRNVERIKNCPNPHKGQPIETSLTRVEGPERSE